MSWNYTFWNHTNTFVSVGTVRYVKMSVNKLRNILTQSSSQLTMVAIVGKADAQPCSFLKCARATLLSHTSWEHTKAQALPDKSLRSSTGQSLDQGPGNARVTDRDMVWLLCRAWPGWGRAQCWFINKHSLSAGVIVWAPTLHPSFSVMTLWSKHFHPHLTDVETGSGKQKGLSKVRYVLERVAGPACQASPSGQVLLWR